MPKKTIDISDPYKFTVKDFNGAQRIVESFITKNPLRVDRFHGSTFVDDDGNHVARLFVSGNVATLKIDDDSLVATYQIGGF